MASAGGTCRMGVSNNSGDGWQRMKSHTGGAETDRQPLGSLNAELYTILFSCLNFGTHGHWRGRDESSVCACVCVDDEAWPQYGPRASPQTTVGGRRIKWHVCERDNARVGIGTETSALSVTRRRWAHGPGSMWKHSHIHRRVCISLTQCEGIKRTFKARQRLAGGLRGPSAHHRRAGQIKTGRASRRALLPSSSSCVLY